MAKVMKLFDDERTNHEYLQRYINPLIEKLLKDIIVKKPSEPVRNKYH